MKAQCTLYTPDGRVAREFAVTAVGTYYHVDAPVYFQTPQGTVTSSLPFIAEDEEYRQVDIAHCGLNEEAIRKMPGRVLIYLPNGKHSRVINFFNSAIHGGYTVFVHPPTTPAVNKYFTTRATYTNLPFFTDALT